MLRHNRYSCSPGYPVALAGYGACEGNESTCSFHGMRLLCIVLIMLCGWALPARPLAAQDGQFCIAQNHDVASLIQVIEAERLEFPVYPSTVIISALGPGKCSWLRADLVPQQVAEELLRYSITQQDAVLASRVAYTTGYMGLTYMSEWGWSPVPSLRLVLETAHTQRAREAALFVLSLNVDQDEVADLLMELATNAVGPALWPDLPSDVTEMLIRTPDTVSLRLGSELQRQPGRLRNPRARFMAECWKGDHALPEEGPCHPSRRPARIRGR